MQKETWIIEYTWIKAHAGIYVNEFADKLAKEEIRNSDICYDKIPKSEKEPQKREKSIEKCNNNVTTLLMDSQPKNFSRILRTD